MKKLFKLSGQLAVLALGLGLSATFNQRQRRRDQARASAITTPALAPTPLAFPSATPFVSVLGAAWNEARLLPDFVASFCALDYPNRELVLCAGGDDGTFALAEGLASQPNITIVKQLPGEGKQVALRRALSHCQGEIIVLTDADCTLNAEGFNRLIAPIIAGEAHATSGRWQPFAERMTNPLVAYQAAVDIYVDSLRGEVADGLLGANCAVSRWALREAGDFFADVATGTDYHLAQDLWRMGYPIRFVWGSCVRAEYAEDWSNYQRRHARWLRNILIHENDLPLTERPDSSRTLRTAAIGFAMLLAPISGLFAPHRVRTALYSLWLVGIVHALGARLRYLAFAHDLGAARWRPATLLWLLPITVFDFYTWASSLITLLNPSQRNRW